MHSMLSWRDVWNVTGLNSALLTTPYQYLVLYELTLLVCPLVLLRTGQYMWRQRERTRFKQSSILKKPNTGILELSP